VIFNERNDTMRKVMTVLVAALVSVGVVGQASAGRPTDAQRAGKQAAVSFRLAATNPTPGFEAMTLSGDRTIYVSPQAALSAGQVAAADAIATRTGSDVSLSLTNEAAGRLGTMAASLGADHLAIFVGGKLVSAGKFSFDADEGLATISGLSSDQARELTRAIRGKSAVPVGRTIAVVASQGTIQAGEAVTLEVFVKGGISDVRAYQVALTISGGTAGELTRSNMWIDTERADYVFRGHDKLDALDRTGGRMGAVILSGGTGAMQRAYLGSYTLEASADASGTFTVNIRTQDTSLVASTGSRFIEFASGPDAVITVGTPSGDRSRDR
jgi:hypothetical protein